MTDEEKADLFFENSQIYLQVTKNPYHLVQELTNYESRFIGNLEPVEESTEKEPPRQIKENAEVIPIDEYLGLYEPKKLKITILKKGIQRASEMIGCTVDDLTYIVRLHEWAHAIVHIGLGEEENKRLLSDGEYNKLLRRKANRIWGKIDPKLHEQLAQLLTYHILTNLHDEATDPRVKKRFGRILEAFEKLRRFQPYEYKIDKYLNVPLNRILQSVKLLKKELLKGEFEVWDTVIRWCLDQAEEGY